jgi:hypothetical protein
MTAKIYSIKEKEKKVTRNKERVKKPADFN